jgi:rSAM/selenodomain-associated transferase 1
MNAPLIILFLKAPVPGKVKTRLANEVGKEEAVDVYRWLVENQLRNLPPHWRVRVAYDPPNALKDFHAWLGTRLEYRPQGEGDLGDRIGAAVNQAFLEGAETVFCVGGDCPNLGPELFIGARSLLIEGNDLVFIPADDGGYVLVGLRTPCPEIFKDIPWSAPDTLHVSIDRAEAAGRRVARMPTLFDIDTRADLERAVRENRTPFPTIQGNLP